MGLLGNPGGGTLNLGVLKGIHMSYGLNVGWGGPIEDYIGFWGGGPIKGYTTNLVQGSYTYTRPIYASVSLLHSIAVLVPIFSPLLTLKH